MTAYNPDASNQFSCCDNRTLTTPIASYVVNSVAELRAMSTTNVQANEVAQTLGYYVVGDGGNNEFYWNTTNVETDNTGSIIKAADRTTGRWLAFDKNSSTQIAAKYEGSNAYLKIRNAIAGLTSDGGVVDATSLRGSQLMPGDPFISGKAVTVLLGVATFTVTGTGTFIQLHDKQRLIGSGRGLTVLKLGLVSFNQAIVGIAANSTDVELAHLTIDGGTDASTMNFGIFADTGNNRLSLHDLHLNEINATHQTVLIDGGLYGKFKDIWINSIGHGFTLWNETPVDNHHDLIDITVIDGSMGFHFVQSNWNTITSCHAFTSTPLDSFEGFNLDSSNDNNFMGCTAKNRGDAGWIETHNENFPGSPPCERNHIYGGRFSGNACDGISLNGIDGVVENALSYNNGQGVATPESGVSCGAFCARPTIRNLNSFDNQSVRTQINGINISGSAIGVVIEMARFRGMTNAIVGLTVANNHIATWVDENAAATHTTNRFGHVLMPADQTNGAVYFGDVPGHYIGRSTSAGALNIGGGQDTIELLNALRLPAAADAAAINDSWYYSTTTSKASYKDSGGTAHALY